MEPILIRRDRLQDSLVGFVNRSALRYCTTQETRGDDAVAVIPSWPVECFSTGEAIAWSLLESLTDGVLRSAFDRLDDVNLDALALVLVSARAAVKAA